MTICLKELPNEREILTKSHPKSGWLFALWLGQLLVNVNIPVKAGGGWEGIIAEEGTDRFVRAEECAAVGGDASRIGERTGGCPSRNDSSGGKGWVIRAKLSIAESHRVCLD